MTTPKQQANLKRGGGTAETAAKALAARQQNIARDEAIGQLGATDPWRAFEELSGAMARSLSRVLRKEDATLSQPDPSTTARVREFRLAIESLTAYRAQHDSTTVRAAEFLATLASRIQALRPEMFERSPAMPIIEPPEA